MDEMKQMRDTTRMVKIYKFVCDSFWNEWKTDSKELKKSDILNYHLVERAIIFGYDKCKSDNILKVVKSRKGSKTNKKNILECKDCKNIAINSQRTTCPKCYSSNVDEYNDIDFIKNINEIKLEGVYEYNELFPVCDFLIDNKDYIFGSVNNELCFRAENKNIKKDIWIVKEIYEVCKK